MENQIERLIFNIIGLTGIKTSICKDEIAVKKKGKVKAMRKKFLAAALGMSLAVSLVSAAGCDTKKTSDDQKATATEKTSEENATEKVSEEASSEAASAQDEAESEEESASGEVQEKFDYSEGYDDKGFFADIRALDYVKLLDYSSMELSDEIIPSDEIIQSQIDAVLKSFTKTNPITDKDCKVEDGDTINIDYVGSMDGVEFEGGSTQGKGTTVTIGVTKYIDDFLEQLIGHTPGENFDIEVTFPDPYENNPDFSGKDAVFNVTINHIVETVVPEFDDDFIAENIPEYESAEAYRQSIYDSIYKQNMYNALFQHIVENSEISEVPDSVVETVYNERYQYFSSYAAMYGVDMETFLKANNMTEDSFREMCSMYAGNYLVLQAVMEDAGWEVNAETAKSALGFTDEDYEEAKEFYGEPYILFAASTDYVLEKLSDNVTLVKIEETSEEAASEEASSEAASNEEVTTEEASSEEITTEESSKSEK